ncbi:MAG: BACON domain-containing protein [Acidobacteriaceae bacterium]
MAALFLVLFSGFSDVCLAQVQVLFGDQIIEGEHDSNSVGTAEAFQATASATGTLSVLNFYVDTNSAAASIVVGLYADNAGNPGSLLTQGTINTPAIGWNAAAVPSIDILTGTKYWIAVLGKGGVVRFRDRSSGPCISEANSSGSLTALPAKWSPGTKYTDCPLTAYGTGSSLAQPPSLQLSTQTINLTATPGGSTVSATDSVTNAGGGTLDFSATPDVSWLTVAPQTGVAPAQLTISADPGTLLAGTYVGHVTVSSPSVQNSPQTITTNLNVSAAPPPNQPGDWLMIEHDPARGGFAADETLLSTANVSTLSLHWSTVVDGQVTAQPLFVGGIPIGSQNHDIVVAATAGNSIYALDATNGSVLWKRNLGSSQSSNCVFSKGFGVTGSPVIDRSRLRVYAVSSGGNFVSVSLIDGSIIGQILGLVANPGTNDVWGGLNQNDKYVYVATGSDGCDDPPYAGAVYKVDVSGSTPVLVTTAAVIPGAGNAAGGGIWGYGGVSVDVANGNVYAAAAADNKSGDSGYANHIIALDANLNVLGSNAPTDPPTYPCSGQPCDLDFASTPLVFQPPACPQLTVAGKKNGNLYLFRTADLISSGQPLQILPINTPNDSLGSGGAGGTASYWPQGNMVFIGTAGGGANGVAGGVVALNVTSSCTLTPAWSHPLGSSDAPNSTVTIANGVALIGVGIDGVVHAYDATNGTALWQSPSYGSTFAAPIVANGSVYYGSWAPNGATSGKISAFWLNGAPPPNPILGVSPQTLNFTEAQGGPVASSQSVSVTNTGTGALSFTAQSDATWLSVTPASGSAPAALTVAVSALATGSYTGHITVTAAGASQSPQTVTVNLTVTAPPPPSPVLSLSTNTLNFSEVQGGTVPPGQSVSITNTGTGTLSFAAQSDATWLTVTPLNGTAPASVAVGVSALTAGSYTGHITVTASGALQSPQTVTVSLIVSPMSTGTLLLGDKTVESEHDSNSSGSAEAFQATAATSGITGSIVFYLDTNSTAALVAVGIYADANGHPGTLLGQVATSSPKAGAWNTLNFPSQSISAGTHYWIAILGSGKGVLHFRDHPSGCTSEASAQGNLITLPSNWSSGTRYTDCPVSIYALGQ